MARGGGKGRSYNRDARGRFASGGSSSGPRRGAAKAGGGTLGARTKLRAAKTKLAAAGQDGTVKGTLSRRSQKGAVTRAQNALAKARKAARVRLSLGGPPKGTVRGSTKGRGAARRAASAAARLVQAERNRRFSSKAEPTTAKTYYLQARAAARFWDHAARGAQGSKKPADQRRAADAKRIASSTRAELRSMEASRGVQRKRRGRR